VFKCSTMHSTRSVLLSIRTREEESKDECSIEGGERKRDAIPAAKISFVLPDLSSTSVEMYVMNGYTRR
jgi:hypothetical protein